MVDTLAVPTTIWVTIPAVYSNAGLFSWHVEITTLTGPLAVNTPLFGSPQDVHLAGLNASSVTSAVHTQLYSMQDGVAATFAVGNTPDIPRVVMFSHAGAYLGPTVPTRPVPPTPSWASGGETSTSTSNSHRPES